MSEFKVTEPYRPRPISFDGVREIAGWRIKMYAITYGPEDVRDFEGLSTGYKVFRRLHGKGFRLQPDPTD